MSPRLPHHASSAEPLPTRTGAASHAAGATDSAPLDLSVRLARQLTLAPHAVQAVLRLVAEGATVPFIARYRKEATGGLDEVQIRQIDEGHRYLAELEGRRAKIIEELSKQGKLSSELMAALASAETKAALEDLYLPHRPKRRTRAALALERGLGPLADKLWGQATRERPEQTAAPFVAPERDVPDVSAALAGARDICAERLSEDAVLRERLREEYRRHATVKVSKTRKAAASKAPTKFDMYAEFEEPVKAIAPHRYLAICRGESEDILNVKVSLDLDAQLGFALSRVPLRRESPWRSEVEGFVIDSLERLLGPQMASEVRAELKQRAEASGIDVFAKNLRELLLAPPFGSKTVLGIDPGQRTGCKCAVVDGTGRLLATSTFNLVQGEASQKQAVRVLVELCRQHGAAAVAVGNGTHGRETESFARRALKDAGLAEIIVCPVSEAGASVYSASELARAEFPALDLTLRGAVSIARRLQDPLAELVKVDPRSIGVGQYQHDLPESALASKLDDVVESCVSHVGVELNTASASLLARVAGIGPKLAGAIVAHRDSHGAFASRQALRKVSGLGPKTFEQAAGFLRITGGSHPLDASAVHPERYDLVERMARDLSVPLSTLIGGTKLLRDLSLARYHTDDVGAFTLDDIVAELARPGRDPRRNFEPPRFRDDVRTLSDLKPGMVLEGVVTNITAFGAFVDLGVHQDGLVHISELADTFVRDPHAVVQVGSRLPVRVLSVDQARQRISLSAKPSTVASS